MRRTWANSLCLFGDQEKDVSPSLQTFLAGVRLRLNLLCRLGSHVLEPVLGSVNCEAARRQFLVYKNYGMARQTPCHLQNPGFHTGESREKQLKVLLKFPCVFHFSC